MSQDRKRAAEERLVAALEKAAVADGRADYRDRMRSLKKRSASSFREATAHYERVVLPGLLESPDPLRVWIDFGITLAGMSGPGRTVAVDGTGRAVAWRGEYQPGDLLLFLPEDRQAEALALAVPRTPSAAQAATLDLLVARRLSL